MTPGSLGSPGIVRGALLLSTLTSPCNDMRGSLLWLFQFNFNESEDKCLAKSYTCLKTFMQKRRSTVRARA